tara:strand:+ start:2859 stop:3050 length:192 start_codon:yes stop_codon:yes gene_type:complete
MNFTKDELQLVLSALHAKASDMEGILRNQDLSQGQKDFLKDAMANTQNVTEKLYTLLFQGDYI